MTKLKEMTRLEQMTAQLKALKGSSERFFYITVAMEGFPMAEIIINPIENLDAKLAYYANTYDDNLKHKYAKEEVRITSFGKWVM